MPTYMCNSDRSPMRAARSAVRAERFPERTDAKVATASTRVPPALASEEIVTQLVIGRSLTCPARLTARGRERMAVKAWCWPTLPRRLRLAELRRGTGLGREGGQVPRTGPRPRCRARLLFWSRLPPAAARRVPPTWRHATRRPATSRRFARQLPACGGPGRAGQRERRRSRRLPGIPWNRAGTHCAARATGRRPRPAESPHAG